MFMVHVKQDLKAILGPKTPATTPENYGWMGFNIQKSLAIIEPFYLLVRPHCYLILELGTNLREVLHSPLRDYETL